MKIKRIAWISALCILAAVVCLTAAAPATDIPRESLGIRKPTLNDIEKTASLNPVSESQIAFTYHEMISILPGDTVQVPVYVDQAGRYLMVLDVSSEGTQAADYTMTVSDGSSEEQIKLPVLWYDTETEYATDRYGNEIIPDQNRWSGFVKGFAYRVDTLYDQRLQLTLSEGENLLVFSGVSTKTDIRAVWIVRNDALISFDAYREKHGNEIGSTPNVSIQLEAENYTSKSDSYIVPASVRSADVAPYNAGHGIINVLDAAAARKAGQKVIYTFTVEKDGWYIPQFHYAQMDIEDMSCYRAMELDGIIPFAEAEAIPFQYTGYKWKTCEIRGKEQAPLAIWLKSGEHTLALTTTLMPYADELEALSGLMTEIREMGLVIREVTGNSADRYRTWNMDEFVPGIADKLSDLADRVDAIYESLRTKCGKEPSFAGTLKVASSNLRMLSANPEKLPSNMALFSEGTSCVSQRLATVSDSLQNQSVYFDRITLNGTGNSAASSKASIWQTMKTEAVKFFNSFSGENQGYSNAKASDGQHLIVWMNRPLQYVTLLQQMADAEFTARSGIPVEIYIMPSESKLVLSNAAGKTPDVALSVANQTPYNLALRGAAVPLSDFDDFYDFLQKEYNLAAYSGLILDNKIYGALETSDFYVMVYRKDILDALDIPIPQTWEDVTGILPKLQRYGMNFYTPIAGNKGTKYLHETTPYLFQAGAALLAGDGFSVDFTGEKAYNGFRLMTDLYLKYSLSQDTPNFYNHFRYGLIPIGITNYSTYILLKNAAPEIAGQWEMALVPGTESEDGKILRCQVAGDKTDLIFADSAMKEEGWKFLKWWLSSEVQSEFANLLLTRYGSEYFWNTANMVSFEQYPMKREDIQTVLMQWKENTRELQKHPASYMIEREISNVWTAVVVNGKDLRTTLVQAEMNVNREIRQKLTEFGYIKDSTPVKEYPVLSEEALYRLMTGKGGDVL